MSENSAQDRLNMGHNQSTSNIDLSNPPPHDQKSRSAPKRVPMPLQDEVLAFARQYTNHHEMKRITDEQVHELAEVLTTYFGSNAICRMNECQSFQFRSKLNIHLAR